MVATTGKAGRGTLLKMGDAGSPEVFTAIANVASFNGPNESMTMLDGTHLNSGEFMEKIPGMKDRRPGLADLSLRSDQRHARRDDRPEIEVRQQGADQLQARLHLDLGDEQHRGVRGLCEPWSHPGCAEHDHHP
jgi:hypothetical protein